MKKIRIKLLALGILATVTIASTPVFASTNTNKTRNIASISTNQLANTTGTVNTSNVNLRSCPGIYDWNVYNSKLQDGDRVLVLSEAGSFDGYYWYKVRVQSGALRGKQGYVASSYVDVSM